MIDYSEKITIDIVFRLSDIEYESREKTLKDLAKAINLGFDSLIKPIIKPFTYSVDVRGEGVWLDRKNYIVHEIAHAIISKSLGYIVYLIFIGTETCFTLTSIDLNKENLSLEDIAKRCMIFLSGAIGEWFISEDNSSEFDPMKYLEGSAKIDFYRMVEILENQDNPIDKNDFLESCEKSVISILNDHVDQMNQIIDLMTYENFVIGHKDSSLDLILKTVKPYDLEFILAGRGEY